MASPVVDVSIDETSVPSPAAVSHGLACPCGNGTLTFIPTGPFGPFYGCSNYPDCENKVQAGRDGRPLGFAADKYTRQARQTAHTVFDRLWNHDIVPKPKMSRREAYVWLKERTKFSNFAEMGAADCEAVVLAVLTEFPDLRRGFDHLWLED